MSVFKSIAGNKEIKIVSLDTHNKWADSHVAKRGRVV